VLSLCTVLYCAPCCHCAPCCTVHRAPCCTVHRAVPVHRAVLVLFVWCLHASCDHSVMSTGFGNVIRSSQFLMFVPVTIVWSVSSFKLMHVRGFDHRPYGIFGRHSGTETGFATSDLISACQYHSAKALYSYLLVYLPHGVVLHEKLAGSWLVKKFPVFYGIGRFITSLTSARQLSLS
jgi:hypothetical protein